MKRKTFYFNIKKIKWVINTTRELFVLFKNKKTPIPFKKYLFQKKKQQ